MLSHLLVEHFAAGRLHLGDEAELLLGAVRRFFNAAHLLQLVLDKGLEGVKIATTGVRLPLGARLGCEVPLSTPNVSCSWEQACKDGHQTIEFADCKGYMGLPCCTPLRTAGRAPAFVGALGSGCGLLQGGVAGGTNLGAQVTVLGAVDVTDHDG